MELCHKKGKYGKLKEKKTFKSYHDSEKLLETYEYFKLRHGDSVIGKFHRPWERSLALEVIIDKKENTEMCYKSNLNGRNRLDPDVFENLLSHFFEWKQWFQPTFQRIFW